MIVVIVPDTCGGRSVEWREVGAAHNRVCEAELYRLSGAVDLGLGVSDRLLLHAAPFSDG